MKNYGIFQLNTKLSSIRDKVRIKGNFWNKVVMTWLNRKEVIRTEDVDKESFAYQKLWYNEMVKYKGSLLHFKRWQRQGIETVLDVLVVSENRMMSWDEIRHRIGDNGGTLFEYYAIRNAIPKMWLNWLRTGITGNQTNEIISFNGLDVRNATAKQFRNLIRKTRGQTEICAVGFWRRKFGFDVAKKNHGKNSRGHERSEIERTTMETFIQYLSNKYSFKQNGS